VHQHCYCLVHAIVQITSNYFAKDIICVGEMRNHQTDGALLVDQHLWLEMEIYGEVAVDEPYLLLLCRPS
jgi:hypothetical protein